METQEKMPEWINMEVKGLTEKGELMRPAVKLNKGENKLVVSVNVPAKKVKTKYGDKMLMELSEPAGTVLICNNFLYGKIIQTILRNQNPRVTIIKAGEGKNTMYDVVGW